MLSYRQLIVLLVVCGVAMSTPLLRQKRQFQTPVTLPAGPGNFRPNNIVSTLNNPAAGQARGGGGGGGGQGGGSFDNFFGTNFGDFQGVMTLPAIVNRPAGGQLRG